VRADEDKVEIEVKMEIQVQIKFIMEWKGMESDDEAV
jgi:hypothetical protein